MVSPLLKKLLSKNIIAQRGDFSKQIFKKESFL